MYRAQQYRDTSRTFGPYLPPYPLQGVGFLDSAMDMISNMGQQASEEAHNVLLQTRMTAEDGTYCEPGFVRGSSGKCEPCPKGTSYNGKEYTCDIDPGSPGTPIAPPAVGPVAPPVTPPAVNPCPAGTVKGPGGSCGPVLPSKPAESTNWTLWLGLAAVAGVVGVLAYRKYAKRSR